MVFGMAALFSGLNVPLSGTKPRRFNYTSPQMSVCRSRAVLELQERRGVA